MPYIAQRTAPDGTVYEEEIPTPEEEAMLLSAGGYGPAPIPPPATAAPLVAPGTAPPPTQQIAYPTAGPPEYNPMGNAGTEQGYGQETAATYGAYVPPPEPQPLNYAAAEPYGTSAYAIQAGGDPNTLRSQSAYSPPPLATIPEPAPTRSLGSAPGTQPAPIFGVGFNTGAPNRAPQDAVAMPLETAGRYGVAGDRFAIAPAIPPPRRQDRRMAASAPPMPETDAISRAAANVPPDLAAGLMLDDPAAAEGVSWGAVLDPGSWLPEPVEDVDENGNPIAGRGEAAFIAGPVAGFGASRARTGARSSVRQRTVRPAPAAEPEPVQPVRTARGAAVEPPPPKPGTQAAARAAGQAGYDALSATPRTALGRPRATTTGTGTAAPAAAPAAPVVGSAAAARGIAPKRLAAILGAGAVGGAVVANNLRGGGEAPGAVITDPGDVPDMTAQVAGWLGRTTSDELATLKTTDPDAWASATKRTPVEIEGVRQKLIESRDVPGLFLGYVDVNGNVVPVGADMTEDEFIATVIANAAEAPEGWGDVPAPEAAAPGASTPQTTTTTGGGTTSAGTTATGGGSSSGGGGGGRSGGWVDYGDSGSRSSGRSSGWRDYGDGDSYDREFTADDFMDQANGDRKKAERLARFANKRRRKRGAQGMAEDGGGFWPGFPFNRPPSPIRGNILASLGEAFAEAFPNRRR